MTAIKSKEYHQGVDLARKIIDTTDVSLIANVSEELLDNDDFCDGMYDAFRMRAHNIPDKAKFRD